MSGIDRREFFKLATVFGIAGTTGVKVSDVKVVAAEVELPKVKVLPADGSGAAFTTNFAGSVKKANDLPRKAQVGDCYCDYHTYDLYMCSEDGWVIVSDAP